MENAIEKKKYLKIPLGWFELHREEKSVCQNILAVAGVTAWYGSAVANLLGGTTLYYSILSFMSFATAALSANPFTALLGLVVASLLIKLGVNFVMGLVGGACNNGMTIETLKFLFWDTYIPSGRLHW